MIQVSLSKNTRIHSVFYFLGDSDSDIVVTVGGANEFIPESMKKVE